MENYFDNKDEFKKKCDSIKASIEEIEKRKTDISSDLDDASFCSDEVALTICYSGYWDEVVLEIIKQIKEDFYYYDPGFYMEPDSVEYKKAEAYANEKVLRCNELLNHVDIKDNYFISGFNKLCEAFNSFFGDVEWPNLE